VAIATHGGSGRLNAMPVCKLCANEADLIKAHVIPRSFWEIDVTQPPPRLVTNVKGVFPKRLPIGVYDQTIVCERCERGFSEYDSYAADLLLNRFNEFEAVRDPNGRLTGYELRGCDYRLLKLFAIAVLWRAAAASHQFFSRIQLGPFEEKAREMLLQRDSGDVTTFPVLFSTWDSPQSSVIMDPCAGRLDGVRAYRFYLGRLVAYVKVDRRPFSEPVVKAVLSPAGPLQLISRDLAASNEFRVMEHIMAANSQLPFGRGRARRTPRIPPVTSGNTEM
jgi:hypothetical protein